MAEGDTRIQADVSVVEFLNALTGEEKQKLYRDPWTAQTVFQALPALAQQCVARVHGRSTGAGRETVPRSPAPPTRRYVLKALFARRPVPQSVSEAWVRMDCAAEHERSIRTLRNLYIMRKCSVPGTEERHYALDGGFQHCLLVRCPAARSKPRCGAPPPCVEPLTCLLGPAYRGTAPAGPRLRRQAAVGRGAREDAPPAPALAHRAQAVGAGAMGASAIRRGAPRRVRCPASLQARPLNPGRAAPRRRLACPKGASAWFPQF